jgi:hypothetical protein
LKGHHVREDDVRDALAPIEPAWSPEQMSMIKKTSSFLLPIVDIPESRSSRPDLEGKFVGREEDGSIVSTEAAYLSTMSPDMYKLGAGQMKYDSTGGSGIYVDIVVVARDESWMINQPTSPFVVVDGVAENIPAMPPKAGAKNNRRIDHDFARIGLPKFAFGPIFHTLDTNFPGILSGIRQSEGYYWLNASWGVSNIKGTHIYQDEDGAMQQTKVLSEIMRMLKGRSSLATATVAISASFKARRVAQDGE